MLISYQYLDTLLGDTGLGGAGDNSTISSLETNTGNSTQAGDTGDLDPVSGTVKHCVILHTDTVPAGLLHPRRGRPDRHVLRPQLPGGHPGRGRGRVQ